MPLQANPMNFIKMIQSGQNPQQLAMSLLENEMSQTPIGRNLMALAQKQDGAGIEMVARNMFKANGLDFDKEFNAFK